MMDAMHVFVASGQACATCEGLAGELVPAGFQPHANCNCNTSTRHGGSDGCTFDITLIGTNVSPNGSVGATILNTVTCANGVVKEGDRGSTTLEHLRSGGADEFLQEVGEDDCDELCEDEEFLCC